MSSGRSTPFPVSPGARPRLLAVAALVAALSACAGPVEIRSGSAGAAPPPAARIKLLDDGAGGAAIAAARQAVVAALAGRGLVVADDGPALVEIAITARSAASAVALGGGSSLSPAKKQRFLQDCEDRTYRLALTYYGAAPDVPVTRSWAEEHHCKGTLEASIPSLADKAVAALLSGTPETISYRRGRD